FGPTSEFTESSFGIREPQTGNVVPLADIDCVLVPLLAFDMFGERVGYGGGFYDRFLSECRPDCLKTGLSLFPPVDLISDTNENDIKLDMVITPDAVFEFN
ncbi:MAG TPA: 5-formyltetrahydrofolate cyclo-ligase, partial [Pyrinomonadaceae bacterium]|nr:5-formyltetrahydrofolate cyclo-ligase [Pyrinomonadaceae bacterium]